MVVAQLVKPLVSSVYSPGPIMLAPHGRSLIWPTRCRLLYGLTATTGIAGRIAPGRIAKLRTRATPTEQTLRLPTRKRVPVLSTAKMSTERFRT